MKNKILYAVLILLGLYAVRNLIRDIKGGVTKEVVRYLTTEKVKTVHVKGPTVYVERNTEIVKTKDAVKIFPDIAEAILSGQAKVIGVEVPKGKTSLGFKVNTSVYIAVKSDNDQVILDENGKPKFIFDLKRKIIKEIGLYPGMVFGITVPDFDIDGGLRLDLVQVYRVRFGALAMTKHAGLSLSYQLTHNVFVNGGLVTPYNSIFVSKKPFVGLSLNF